MRIMRKIAQINETVAEKGIYLSRPVRDDGRGESNYSPLAPFAGG
jgi:hypothetical protein